MARMMVGVAAGLLVWAPAVSAAALDQSQTQTSSVLTVAGPNGGAQSLAQTFTAGASGRLERVELFVRNNLAAASNPLTVQLRDVTADGRPGAWVFTAQDVAAASVPASGGWVPVRLVARMRAGSRYALVLIAGGADAFSWWSSDGDAYARGAAFYTASSPPSGAWTSVPRDFAFKTYVSDTPAAIAPQRIAAGGDGVVSHSCAVKTDSSVACWGDNRFGQLSVPAGSYTQVAAGALHTCGVKTDGSVACWGFNASGQLSVPAGSYTQVAAGREHTCAVKTDSSVACWGDNLDGQLSVPAGSYSQVAAGAYHSCAVKTDGSLACWGDNASRQTSVPAGSYTQVAAGGRHSCAVKTDSSVACWGDNRFGQLSVAAGSYTQVAAGALHTCGVKADGSVACWGFNGSGRTSVPAGSYAQVAAGHDHTCAVKTDGSVACWGSNLSGETSVPAGLRGPIARTTTGTVEFGEQQEGTTSAARTVTVTNEGATRLTVSDASFSGAQAADFSVDASRCAQGVEPAASCELAVRFTPAAVGARAATLDVTTNDIEGSVLHVAVSGTGTAAPAAPPVQPPAAPPVQPPAVVGSAGPSAPLTAASGPFTAKLSIARATINRRHRVLDVLAPITSRASGRADVELHAAGRRYRFTAPVDSVDGRIRFRQRIPKAQAQLGTGILTITYRGDADTRPQTVRLRAASQQAKLRLERPKITGGRLRASGTVSDRARGVVRVQIEYVVGGDTSTLQFKAPISNGRWSLNEQLSQTVRKAIAQRTGTVHSYTLFTGYYPRRVRGEMRSFQILGPR